MHQAAPKMTRQRTDRSTVMKLAIFCSTNSDKLSGLRLSEIAGRVRKHFSGEALTDNTIRAALDASGVSYSKRKSTYGHRTDRVRALAGIVLKIADRIEREFGAIGRFLDNEEREILGSLNSGRASEESSSEGKQG